MATWVQIHSIQRCYGGPEEGGWWYDERTIIFEKRTTKRLAKKLAKKLRHQVAEMQPRRNRFKMRGGPDVELYVGKYRFEETHGRPRYE